MNKKSSEKSSNELSLKKPNQVQAETGFTIEHAVENSSPYEMFHVANVAKKCDYTTSFARENVVTELEIEDLSFSLQYKDSEKYLQNFDLSNMREKMSNGESISSICNDMKRFIVSNYESNPELVQYAICKLLGDSFEHYDSSTNNFFHQEGFTRASQGDTTEEILTKVLNTPDGEELHGFVCSTISEFGMKLLDECGIKATMLCGGTKKTNHTTLLWQRADGKYVQSNYGKSYVLDAPTIKDAAREVYKKNLGLLNNGYIYFLDAKGSYQEFAMKDEAVWGDELDKRDYNNQSVFNRTMADNTKIGAKVNYSNLGSVSAEVSGVLAYGNQDGTLSKETSFSLGYKSSHSTSLADNSKSIGAKIEHKVEKVVDDGKKFSGFKAIVDYTTLNTNSYSRNVNYLQPIADREFTNQEQIDKLRDWYSDRYDETRRSVESYQAELNELNATYEHYQNFSVYRPSNPSPISKEDWINDFIKKYSEHGLTGDFLTSEAEYAWNDYLVENFYDGTNEVLNNKIGEIQDRIINFDKYKEEYINERLAEIKGVDFWNDNPCGDTQEEFSTTSISAFVKKDLGREKVLLKDGNLELTNGYQFSGLLGLNYVTSSTLSFGGDARISAEDGLKLDVKNKTSLFSNSVSGGVVADFALKTGELKPTVSPGVKLNASSVFKHKVGSDITFGAGVSGYAVVTRPSSDFGATGYVQAAYKSGKNTTIFGSIQSSLEKQKLRVGSFNQLTENVTTFGATVGANIKNKGSVSLNYYRTNDKLNVTRNKDVISISANMNL